MVDDRQSITIIDALQALKPKSEWHLSGDELEWLSPDIDKPTQTEIDAEIIRLQAEYDAKKYQRDRKVEYPDLGDQLDALYHAGVFPKEMADMLKAVKDKYPKG